ncbi:cubilin-like isoform X2 [Biomphalaria glabrata]|uniref:Cubilin-like isoform X2 n=1 Tax=Biomphalaria glabrata TaxID=6526 RepID=A0A9W3AKJ3_BIOGL|nr:cubilin-like isoform X2 [Biomphalaria glabrata]KAI8792425.1 cubilin isoform X1 [Biomphalaria glabrata]
MDWHILLGFSSMIATLSENYTAAQTACKSITSKKDFGSECNVSTDCITGICTNKTCTCQQNFFYDNCSQTCIKNCNNTLQYTASSNMVTGLIVSADAVNPPGTKCFWEISSWSGSYLTLIIDYIDMDPAKSDINWVNVLSSRAQLLIQYDSLKSNFIRTMSTESSWLRVYYSTTFSGYKGFRASYYIYDFNSVLTSPSGYIVSPGYPRLNPTDRRYTWLITGKSGQLVTLRFKSRVIDCPGDFLNIYDGIHTRDPLIATLCNGNSTLTITSTTPNLLIYYQNDNYESWGVGFVAYYYIHGQYGDYCNSSDQCPLGFVCNNSRKCDCLNSEKYDPKYKICKNERVFGDTCSNTNLCSNGLVCVNDKCDCSANMYYNTSLKNCISGQYGDYCNSSDQCSLGLVCNDSRKCDCLNSEEYDPKYKICKNGSQENSQNHH